MGFCGVKNKCASICSIMTGVFEAIVEWGIRDIREKNGKSRDSDRRF